MSSELGAFGSLIFHVYIDRHINRLDPSLLSEIKVSQFDSDKEQVDVNEVRDTLCNLMAN